MAPAALAELLPDVTPLAPLNRAAIERERPPPVAEQHLRDEQQALCDTLSGDDPWEAGLETGEELKFLRDGLAPDVLRKLRRGHWKIQRELDLHGFTAAEAAPLLSAFLARALADGVRCVRVIHGKGLGSKNGEPVLKRKVAVWLARREDILAYCQARRTEGGAGAAVVLLKSSTR
jgi:DNA-nicking Smr family endonuclease